MPTNHAHVGTMADRIVMCESPDDLMFEMQENKQIILEDMYRHVRMPSSCVWIEWHTAPNSKNTVDNMQIGVLLDEERREGLDTTGKIAVAVIAASKAPNGRCSVVYAGALNGLPNISDEEGMFANMSWAYDEAARHHRGTQKDFVVTITAAIFTLFIMQHPRLTERERVTHPVAVQKKRVAHNKLPLLAYERVYIRINKDVPASVRRTMADGTTARNNFSNTTTTTDDVTHRRYHKVLGHFRTYYRGDARERVIWIEPHWRGDPTLGVVLHEHRVEKGRVPTP
jgi:hypothetical protein